MLVKDHHRLIARLVPLSGAEEMEAEELEMAAAGLAAGLGRATLSRACRINAAQIQSAFQPERVEKHSLSLIFPVV